ncbi:MAG: ABC transporter ATP-binding protein [Acidobacteriota bacterium]|nr:MAG: ABC transporter ATP-binding protein [Acidobacteriota bacterium]
MVSFRQVEHRYGDVVAVRDFDLDLERGVMAGLIGPDGAGKTTTLRIALGLISPSKGTISTCGLDPRRSRRALSRRIGYLSQRFSLYGDLSVDENIAFFARIHDVSDWKQRRERLLALVRLEPFRRRLAEQLSGGMKQKLALACTLIHTPDLLVLDEPTTGVDPVSRRDFWKLLVELQAEGLTILMTTPYLDEAERCQQVALMYRGRLLALDEPRHLREQHQQVIFELIAQPRERAKKVLEQAEIVSAVETFGERFHVSVARARASDPSDAAREIEARLVSQEVCVEAARLVPASLEDVFIALVRREVERDRGD